MCTLARESVCTDTMLSQKENRLCVCVCPEASFTMLCRSTSSALGGESFHLCNEQSRNFRPIYGKANIVKLFDLLSNLSSNFWFRSFASFARFRSGSKQLSAKTGDVPRVIPVLRVKENIFDHHAGSYCAVPFNQQASFLSAFMPSELHSA